MSEPAGRQRRAHNEIKNAIREHMRTLDGEPATTRELTPLLEERFAPVAKSTIRVALQDERYFTRVSPGVFLLKEGA